MKEEDKNKVIEFFKNEVAVGFCSKDYFERIEWYFNTFFSPPATDKPVMTDEDRIRETMNRQHENGDDI